MAAARLGILLAVLLLPGLLLAPVWRLAGLGAGEDDLLYYFPARSFFHDTIRAGHWPWLSPWTGLGRPFAADPQAAIWYPPTWLFAVLPPLWAYPIALWAHYSLALWGAYRLLRALGLARPAAVLGGLTFAFSGFLLAHRAHFTMQHAAAWTPWVFWRLRRYALAGAEPGGLRRLGSAAAVMLLQCLAGHVQVAALTALGTLAVIAVEARPPADLVPRAAGRGPALARWLIAWVCVAGLFAVQWLPTLEFLRLCTRTQRTYLDFVENSWNPAALIGVVLPMFFGQRTPNLFDQPYWGPSHQVEQFPYIGLLPLLLALLALRGWRADPRRRPWVVLAALGLLLALGTFAPLCPVLYWLPGSSLFRCPARTLLLVHLAAAVLAAHALHDLAAPPTPWRARLRAAALRWSARPLRTALLLVAVPLALVALALPLLPAAVRTAALQALRPWSPAVWVPLLVAAASLALLHQVARRWQRPALLWLIPALAAVDLGIVGWTIDVPAGCTSAAQLLPPRAGGDWLDPVRREPHRLWVVTARRGRTPGEYIDPVAKAVANTNLLHGVEALTHYGPLQPRAMVRQLGLHPWGESWHAARLLADTRWMRLCDVGWILLCEAHWPAPAGCDLLAVTPAGWRLYHNPSAAGPALLEHAGQPAAARLERHGPNALTVHVDTWPAGRPPRAVAASPGAESASAASPGAAGPSDTEPAGRDAGPAPGPPRLVIAQLALPGWTVRIDGRPAAIEAVGGLLLGVRVPPGEAAVVTAEYFPPGLLAGALITLLSAVVLGGALAGGRLRRAVRPPPAP